MIQRLNLKNLHYLVRWFVYAVIAITIIIDIVGISSVGVSNGMDLFGALALITIEIIFFGFMYAFGRICWALAYNKDRNTDFAFVWGITTGLLGAILYWIYTLFHQKNPDNWEPNTMNNNMEDDQVKRVRL